MDKICTTPIERRDKDHLLTQKMINHPKTLTIKRAEEILHQQPPLIKKSTLHHQPKRNHHQKSFKMINK